MTIQYINNTCDIQELAEFGEIGVIISERIPIFKYDYSDGYLDITDSKTIDKEIRKIKQLKSTESLKFEKLTNLDDELIKRVKKFIE